MKTTIYELLGMIKDGKTPKRIVYRNNYYEWFDNEKDYITEAHWLFDEYVIPDILNDEVEILETTITYKPDKIEKLNIALFDDDNLTTNNKLKHIAFRVNEIIDRWNNER